MGRLSEEANGEGNVGDNKHVEGSEHREGLEPRSCGQRRAGTPCYRSDKQVAKSYPFKVGKRRWAQRGGHRAQGSASRFADPPTPTARPSGAGTQLSLLASLVLTREAGANTLRPRAPAPPFPQCLSPALQPRRASGPQSPLLGNSHGVAGMVTWYRNRL